MGAFDNICQLAGVRYHKALHNSDLVDVSFLRKARDEGVRLPTAGATDRDYFWGAYVFPPQAGLHAPVGYLDLASLYPNLIIMLNASPDTVIGDDEAFAASQYDESEVVWAPIDYRPIKRVPRDSETPWQTYTDPDQYKMIVEETGADEWTKRWEDPDGPQTERLYFIAPHVKEGFITDAVRDWIAEKYEYEGGMYAAIKQIVNSTYGYLGFTNSRLFDWRLAEAITLAGREVIKYTAWEAQSYIHDSYDTDTSVKMGDTDGCGIVLEDVTDTDWAREVYADAAAHVNDAYDSFCRETFGVCDHTMDVEVESVAARVFVPASSPSDPDSDGVKKRYGQHIVWDEGEDVDEITVTGLEATRSDTAPITERLQMDVMETLLREGTLTDDLRDQIRDAYTAACNGETPLDELAPRKGLSSPPTAYGSDTRVADDVARGAKYANAHIDGVHVGAGDKPALVYPERMGALPATYTAETNEDGRTVDVVSLTDVSALPSDVTVDWHKHANKTIRDPLKPIIETVGYEWDALVADQRQTGLTDY